MSLNKGRLAEVSARERQMVKRIVRTGIISRSLEATDM